LTISGVGVGLRTAHLEYVLRRLPPVPWFEFITENLVGDKALIQQKVKALRKTYPIVLHGIGLSLGSADGVSKKYLAELKKLIYLYEPAWVSDHLCWSQIGGAYVPDLLPLPHTQEAVDIVSENILTTQAYLGMPIIIENISRYLGFNESEMTECDFIKNIVKNTGCGLLLDINNIYVTCKNMGLDPNLYLDNMRELKKYIKQFHLAGYTQGEGMLIDSHAGPVHDPVWSLFKQALKYFPDTPSLIEWDNDLPDFQVLQAEAKKAEKYYQYELT
jgi:uncharacterized protein (UPF0276 family)